MKIFFLSAFCLLMLICSIYDIKKRIIPNTLIIIIFSLGLINSVLFSSLKSAMLGVIIPSLPLLILKSKMKHIGAGDIKLISAIGTWSGWLLNISIFAIASICALIYALSYYFSSKKQLKSVPFAPFLLFGCLSIFLASLLI
ncbi:MAG TPA: A24 family peptidase [Clostridia bacterium]